MKRIGDAPHMRKHDNAILGKMEICLNSMGADFHGGPEGTHGVLGEGRLVAPMGDSLRHLELLGRQCHGASEGS